MKMEPGGEIVLRLDGVSRDSAQAIIQKLAAELKLRLARVSESPLTLFGFDW